MKFKDLLFTFFYIYICGLITLTVLIILYLILTPILSTIGLIEPMPDMDTLFYSFEENLSFPLQRHFIVLASGLPLFFFSREKINKKFRKKKNK